MAKLTRQAQQIFAGQAPSDMIAAFGSTQTGTPVYSTDLSTLQTTNYQQGWQDAIITDKAPFLEEMNGVQYGLSYQIAYALQMGIPEWLSTQDYYTGSRCIASDYNVYKSLIDDNIGNNPVTDDGTNWVLDIIPEANVLNYITNCITSAPNGVPSYTGTTVTVQEGTNYLFPNGRNSNNGIQNINFALASAATGTITGSTLGTYCVFVTSELDLIFANQINYFITKTQPTALNDSTTAGVWFNPQTNLIYQCTATSSTPSWSTFEGAICATLIYNGSTITAFNPIYPVELAKQRDIDGIWTNSEKQLLKNVSITDGSIRIIDLSDYLPNDGNVYEILMVVSCTVPANTTIGFKDLIVYSDLDFGSAVIAGTAEQKTFDFVMQNNNFIQIVGARRVIRVYRTAQYLTNALFALKAIGYRKVR